MTYPPANPGYPAPQQPGGYGIPAGPTPGPAAADARKVPGYLAVAVVVLGMAAYLASFGPLLSISTDIGPFGGAEFTASGLSYWTVAALVASLLAAVGMLPKSRPYTAIVAVAAVLGLFLVIGQVVNRPSGMSVGWALWLVLLFTLLQAAAAITALLLESGLLSSSSPRPQPYGQYGPPPGYQGPSGVPGPQQHPGYPAPPPAQYPGGYSAGGYNFPDTSAPDTPPTGFPRFGTQFAPTPVQPTPISAQQPPSGQPPALAPEPPSGQAPPADQASGPSSGPTQP